MSFELAQDDGDKSVEDHEHHVQSAVQSMKSEQLDDIEQALKKLSEGSYGICEECGCEIPLQRLAIQPFASYCVPCQEEIDRFSKRQTLLNKNIPPSTDESYEYLPED
jgi:DnaK suppressor protein